MSPPSSDHVTERSHEERRFAAAPGGSVQLDLAFHDIDVTVEAGEEIVVEVTTEITAAPDVASTLINEYAPSFEDGDGKVTVRSDPSLGASPRGRVEMRGRAVVHMPPELSLDLGTSSGRCTVTGDLGDAALVCTTSSGGLSLGGGAREVRVESSSGPVTLALGRLVTMARIVTSSGTVEVKGPVVVLHIDSSSGDCRLDRLVGHLIAETSSGGIDARWAKPPRGVKVRIDAGSGDVRLVFPTGTDLSGRVSTGSGGVTSDFPGSSGDGGRELTLPGPDGGASLEIETGSGGVRLLRR